MIFRKEEEEVFEKFSIYHYKKVFSTNLEAFNLLDKKKVLNETAIIADKQIKGKGKNGKNWISPKGNFYVSLIINLFNSSSFIVPMLLSRKYMEDLNNKFIELIFVVTVAVGDTLSLFMNNVNIQYKWPNDILVGDKKISGILIEKKSTSDWVIIGIGINIDCAPVLGSTCMRNYYYNPISNMNLLKKLIINFNKLRNQWIYTGFYIIREMWLKRAFKINEEINVKSAGKLYHGIFIKIDRIGRIVLKQRDGSLTYCSTGELFIN